MISTKDPTLTTVNVLGTITVIFVFTDGQRWCFLIWIVFAVLILQGIYRIPGSRLSLHRHSRVLYSLGIEMTLIIRSVVEERVEAPILACFCYGEVIVRTTEHIPS